MSVGRFGGEVQLEELLVHLTRLPAPRSRATAPEAVEATLAYAREVFTAHASR